MELRTLILVLNLLWGLNAAAEGPHPVHISWSRPLFFDMWSNTYVRGDQNDAGDSCVNCISFEVCKDEICEKIAPSIPVSEAAKYNEPLLRALSKYRYTVNQRKDFLYSFSTDGGLHPETNNADALALDQLIAEIRKFGLQSWISRTPETQLDPSPEIPSSEVMNGVVERMRQVLLPPRDSDL